MNLSSILIRNSNDETNFSYKRLLTDIQISTFGEGFANGSSANIKFSKTQMSKMIQSGGIFTDLLAAILQAIFLKGIKAFKKVEKGV